MGSAAAILIFILVGAGFAIEPGAGDAAHFLRDGVGARARGMGGAFTAIADDINAPYWNPAGLIQSPSLRVGGTYESRYGGLSEFYYVAGTLISSRLGGGFLWSHSDMYSVYTLSGGVGWNAVALGISGKLYAFTVPGQRASGLGIGVGCLYRATVSELNLTVGATSNDIGWSVIRWEGEDFSSRDHVAWVNRFGMAVAGEMPGVRWRLGTEWEVALRRPPLSAEEDYFATAVQTNLRLGGEVDLRWFTLRAGFADISLENGEGLSLRPCFGAGVQLEGIVIDVAWVPSQLGGTYLLTMEFGL